MIMSDNIERVMGVEATKSEVERRASKKNGSLARTSETGKRRNKNRSKQERRQYREEVTSFEAGSYCRAYFLFPPPTPENIYDTIKIL